MGEEGENTEDEKQENEIEEVQNEDVEIIKEEEDDSKKDESEEGENTEDEKQENEIEGVNIIKEEEKQEDHIKEDEIKQDEKKEKEEDYIKKHEIEEDQNEERESPYGYKSFGMNQHIISSPTQKSRYKKFENEENTNFTHPAQENMTKRIGKTKTSRKTEDSKRVVWPDDQLISKIKLYQNDKDLDKISSLHFRKIKKEIKSKSKKMTVQDKKLL